jgi:hypothetical protein
MNKLFPLSLFFLFVCTYASAQNNLPAAYEITNDTTTYTKLPDRYWQMLEDREGKLSFDEVSRSPIAEKFHFNQVKNPQFIHSIDAYWFRYVLKNTMAHSTKIYLSGSGGHQDFYFVAANGNLTHEVNGWLTPWSKQDGLKGIGVITVELKPSEQLVVHLKASNCL